MIEANPPFKDSNPNKANLSTCNSLNRSLSSGLDQEPSYQQLNALFDRERKISLEQREQLAKTEVEFEKFNKVFHKQAEYVERMDARLQQQEVEFRKERAELVRKNEDLQGVVRRVEGRLAGMLRIIRESGQLEDQKMERQGQNPEEGVEIWKQLEVLEKNVQAIAKKLREQGQTDTKPTSRIPDVERQTTLLKQQLKTICIQNQKLKQRLKMVENILSMAEKDKQRINAEWMQEVQQDKIEELSMKELKSTLGCLRIEQRHLKRRNKELMEEIEKLVVDNNQRVEGLVVRIERMEQGLVRKEMAMNRARQFTT